MASSVNYWETVYKTRAAEEAASGHYVGFGELASLHYSLRSSQPYIAFPTNHALLLWLSDLASTNNMTIQIHMEATTASVTELEALLAHNTATKIVWDHAGWTNSGVMTAGTAAQLLGSHSNLYLTLKLRNPDSDALESGHPLDSAGVLKSDWQSLISSYSNRIMLGSDLKYWEAAYTPAALLEAISTLNTTLLDQLSASDASNLRTGTAQLVYGM